MSYERSPDGLRLQCDHCGAILQMPYSAPQVARDWVFTGPHIPLTVVVRAGTTTDIDRLPDLDFCGAACLANWLRDAITNHAEEERQ